MTWVVLLTKMSKNWFAYSRLSDFSAPSMGPTMKKRMVENGKDPFVFRQGSYIPAWAQELPMPLGSAEAVIENDCTLPFFGELS